MHKNRDFVVPVNDTYTKTSTYAVKKGAAPLK